MLSRLRPVLGVLTAAIAGVTVLGPDSGRRSDRNAPARPHREARRHLKLRNSVCQLLHAGIRERICPE